jgi:hypothetical protein
MKVAGETSGGRAVFYRRSHVTRSLNTWEHGLQARPNLTNGRYATLPILPGLHALNPHLWIRVAGKARGACCPLGWRAQGHADPRLDLSCPGPSALRTTCEACVGTCAHFYTSPGWSHWRRKACSVRSCFTVWEAIATYEATHAFGYHSLIALRHHTDYTTVPHPSWFQRHVLETAARRTENTIPKSKRFRP